MHRNKCNEIQVLTETFEVFDGEHSAELNGPYGLVDIMTGQRTLSSLSSIKKFGYLTKYCCPLDLEF